VNPLPIGAVIFKFRHRLEIGPDAAYFFENLDFPVANRRFDAYYAQFLPVPASSARPHAHLGIEFLYVIAEKLVLQMSDEPHILATGDAVYFDSTIKHSYRSGTRRTSTALVVTTGAP
jgi:quercetin dioxygenase-like cupin family protein